MNICPLQGPDRGRHGICNPERGCHAGPGRSRAAGTGRGEMLCPGGRQASLALGIKPVFHAAQLRNEDPSAITWGKVEKQIPCQKAGCEVGIMGKKSAPKASVKGKSDGESTPPGDVSGSAGGADAKAGPAVKNPAVGAAASNGSKAKTANGAKSAASNGSKFAGKAPAQAATAATAAPANKTCAAAKARKSGAGKNMKTPGSEGIEDKEQPADEAAKQQAIMELKRKLHHEIFEKCLEKKILNDMDYWDN